MGDRERVLGIDLGIASCGWGIIDVGEDGDGIVAAGVRCFDAPLVDKTGEPKSAARRTARGQRRIIRRRRQRMTALRTLLHRHGLLPDAKDDALAQALKRISPSGQKPQATPWTLRAHAHKGQSKIMVVHRLDAAAGRFKLAPHNETGNLDRRHATDNYIDPFRWLMASYGTLKRMNALPVRVDELGRVWRVQPRH